ncbi:MAG: hypothetical protein Ct9H300mP14_13820 [Gammaproteobacteria bacterium]|nr:MAG: hypothetical protein Ct9H300mP14_13820 [Gammaproteobacteria bacterium]
MPYRLVAISVTTPEPRPAALFLGVFPLSYCCEVARFVANIKLSWPPDLALRRFEHFLPVSDPADGTPDGEQYSKHVGGKSKCPQENFPE